MAKTQSLLDPSALGVPSPTGNPVDAPDVVGLGNVGGLSDDPLAVGASGPTQNTLDIDTSGFGPTPAIEDIELGQPRISKPAKPSRFTEEQKTAAGTLAGTGIREAVNIFANTQNLKAKDAEFQNRLQKGFEDLEFNQRLLRTDMNIAAGRQAIAAMENLRRQAPAVGGGRQTQLFLNDPATGARV